MKDPIEILKEEHNLIINALNILESFTKLDLKKVLVSDVKRLLEFFSQFADKCHHAKEEDLLFPLAEKKGIQKEGGPIGVMLIEHDEGRKLRKSMTAQTNNLNKTFNRFRKSAEDFIILLKGHIEKEDNVLYPMIDSILSEKEKEKLLEEFEKIEEKTGKGVHEKYVKLIKELGRKYGKGNK